MCLKEAIAKEICLERNMHFASDRHVTNLNVFIRTLWALPYLRSHFFAGMPVAGPSKSINASIQRFLSAQTQLAHFVEQVCYKLHVWQQKGHWYRCLIIVLEEEKRLLAENLRAWFGSLSNGRGSIFFVQIECCFLNLKMKCSRWGEDCFRYLDWRSDTHGTWSCLWW
jgi:hypothetical protein